MMFIGLLAASSCNDKLVCSAYQSYFVLDNVNYPRNGYPKNRAEGLEANRFDYPDASYHQRENPIRDEYYAYLDSDSMPKVANAEKDQFGIIKKQRLRAKDRAMQNIPMEVVIPPAPDSLLFNFKAAAAEPVAMYLYEGYESTKDFRCTSHSERYCISSNMM